MQYTDADVFVYQLMDMFVCQYDYKIVNIPGNRRDVWLVNENNAQYPMIRLTSTPSTSIIFEKDYLSKIKSAISVLVKSDKPLLILNTHNESQEYKEEGMFQVVVNDAYVSDNHLLQYFPILLTVVRKVKDNQSECARLVRNLENVQRKKIKEANKFTWKKAPQVSLVLVAISLIVYLLTSYFAKGTFDETWLSNVILCGGYYKAMIVYGHEYWRIFTSTFVHYNVFGLLFNAIVMYQMGKMLEPQFKKWQYLLIFLVSGTFGHLLLYVFGENTVSIGMAGGIYGLLAAFLVVGWEKQWHRNPFTRFKSTNVMMLCIGALWITGAGLLVYLGGFIAGLFLAILFSKHPIFKDIKVHFLACFVMISIILGYGAAQVQNAYPEYNELDTTIVERYKELGLVKHSEYVDNYFKDAYEE